MLIKINKILFIYFLMLTIIGCMPIDVPRVSKNILPQKLTTGASPPVYVKVLKQKLHKDLLEKIDRVNIPSITLAEALYTIIPFPVTVQKDASVDLNKDISLRISTDKTVKDFLSYLSNLTGYSLVYEPNKKTVNISSLDSKSWYFPALINRPQTAVDVSDSESEADDEEGDFEDDYLSIKTKSISNQSIEWDDIVVQAQCMLKLSQCPSTPADIKSDGSMLISYKNQGSITAVSTPSKIKMLDQWLSSLEKELNRFIQLQIALINIRKGDEKQRNLDLEPLFDAANSNFTVQYKHNFLQNDNGQLIIGGNVKKGNFSLDTVINILDEKTDSELLHKVNIIVATGETAIVNSTDKFYFASGSEVIPGNAQNNQIVSTDIREESVGIQLAVTPRFIKPGSDVMNIRVVPLISSLMGYDSVVSNGQTISRAPRLSSNTFVSHSILRSGQTTIIAGLASQSADTTRQNLPFIKSIPFLKGYSSNAVDSELFIVLSAYEVGV